MNEEKKEEVLDLYLLKRRLQREKRDLRKKILGIDEDHKDTSMQRIYGEGTKTKRALKIELFGSKSKASATKGEETSIEAFIREFLLEQNIEFVEQKAIRFINVDFYLPQFNLVIECLGGYWHCDPRFYPEPKNKTQRKNIEKDKRALEICKKEEHNILLLWEHDIKNREELTIQNLNRILNDNVKIFEESSEWN